MNSEILSIPTSGNYGVIFNKIDSIPHHPAQLYEAIVYLILFFSLWKFYYLRKGLWQSGLLFGILFLLLFSARFLIEFVKINQVAFEEGMALNMGQLLSLPMILLGGIVLIIKSNRITK